MALRALVLVIALAVLPACGGGADDAPSAATGSTVTDRPASSTTTTLATGVAQDPLPDDGPEHFTTPSGNIGCMFTGDLAEGSVRCDVAERDWQPPPRPADCELDWAVGVELDSRGPRHVCAGDTVMGGGAVLAYGRTAAHRGLECASEVRGVSCLHRATGRGFAVSRASYRWFIQCQTVGFTPASEDAAGQVRATGLDCDAAEAFVDRAGRVTSSGGPESVEVDGWRCVRTGHADDPLPRSEFDCTKGERRVSFTRT
ncbi:MAG TPA: DUF6636 domain-containing protein [Acidimicrobiales bacterium]|nr:DUF6636 domain-containing protein [Acidimicrobiales bacterium]